jgi:tRNA nucleotidyltransferase/poly(A) polymerase
VGLRLLYELRLLSFIIPEIARLAKVKQSKNYHSEGNVFVHTLLALSLVEQDADLTTLYGLLFHDIGKGSTGKATIKHGRRHISFTGHPEKGEMLVKKILKRLKFSNKEIEDIAWYVRNHHIPVALPQMRRAKQMRWCLEPRFKNLLQIFRADSLASIPTDTRGRKQCPSLDLYDFAIKISAQAVSQKVLTKRFVTGVDVMRILKIKPGPRVGKILRDIEERQLGGKIKNRKQALQFLQKLK